MFRYYWVVPPRWGLASSVLFTAVPMSYKIKNTLLILLSHFIFVKKHDVKQICLGYHCLLIYTLTAHTGQTGLLP